MTKPILKRSLRLIVSLLVFSFIFNGLLYLSTGDPVLIHLRSIGVETPSKEMISETKSQLGLQGNYFQQYCHWLIQIFHGHFGTSFAFQTPVIYLLITKLKVSVALLFWGMSLSLVASLSISFLIGNSQKRQLQTLCGNLLVVLLSFPIYWTALLLILFLGVTLSLFPFVGNKTSAHLVLPTMTILLSEGAYLIKMTSDLYYQTSRLPRHLLSKYRGLTIYFQWLYQTKDILIPLMTLWGNSLIHLFGMLLMIENIFSIPGIGQLLLNAIITRDYPLIQIIVLFIALLTFLTQCAIDILIISLDSRLKINRK